MKKATWKDYLISVIALIAVLCALLKGKEYTSGYILFLQYAVIGLLTGVVIGLVFFFMKKGKVLLCLSAALSVFWFLLPAEGPVNSGLLGCAASTLIISVPAFASLIATFSSGKNES